MNDEISKGHTLRIVREENTTTSRPYRISFRAFSLRISVNRFNLTGFVKNLHTETDQLESIPITDTITP